MQFNIKKIKADKIIFWSLIISSILFIPVGLITSNVFLNIFKGNLIPLIVLFAMFLMINIMNLIANIAINTVEQQNIPLSMMGNKTVTTNLNKTIQICIEV